MDEDARAILAISSAIEAAAGFNDRKNVRYGARLLLETIDDSTELLDQYGKYLFGGVRLSSREPQGNWLNEGPVEIVESMRTAVAVDEATMESYGEDAKLLDEADARKFDGRRVRLRRLLSFSVQMGRRVILEKWPQFWTTELEKEFEEYLVPPIF